MKNVKTNIYTKHDNLQNVIQLSASSQQSLVDQMEKEIFPSSVSLLLLFVLSSSFQTLLHPIPQIETAYNPLF